MIIDESFEKYYLNVGMTYDNFIFENCPFKFVKIAEEKLKKSNAGVKPCQVVITKEMEQLVENTINNCSQEFQKKLLARDFITALIIKEMLAGVEDKSLEYKATCGQIKAFLDNEFEKVKEYHSSAFYPSDVKECMKLAGKIELNFFLYNTQSKLLQQAINIFISSREPYSVKIFTTNDKLPTYYDQTGNIIQCPHDYMTRDVNKFIEQDDTIIKE